MGLLLPKASNLQKELNSSSSKMGLGEMKWVFGYLVFKLHRTEVVKYGGALGRHLCPTGLHSLRSTHLGTTNPARDLSIGFQDLATRVGAGLASPNP